MNAKKSNHLRPIEDCISKNDLASIRKILIIQYKPFGDVLLNTGYLPTLRNQFPNAQIDYLVQKPYKTLLEDNPNINKLLLMEKKKKKTFSYFAERLRIIHLVRKERYDVIIDQLRGPGSAQITMFSGAKFKLGWLQKRWNWVYNYKVKRDNFRYYSRAKFDLLKPLGITEQPHNTYYKIISQSIDYIDDWIRKNQLENDKLLVVSPVSPIAAKQWQLESFATLCDLIIQNTNFKIILLWGPGEKDATDKIVKMMKEKPIIACPTTFNQAGALLKKAMMYIGNDGGINHLAIAMETPSITIFGPKTNPKKWVAWHKPQHMYLRDWNFKDRTDNSFNITPEQVFDKFKDYFNL